MIQDKEDAPPKGDNKSGILVEGITNQCNYLQKYKKSFIDISSLAPVLGTVATSVNEKFPCSHEEDPRCYLKRAIWDSEDTVFETIDGATSLLRKNVVDVTREIAGRCDKCSTIDGKGFSKIDVVLGHRIAVLGIPRDWQSVRVRRWVQRLSKYSNQVHGNFYDRVFVGE